MRHLKILAIAVLGMTLFFTSCKKNESTIAEPVARTNKVPSNFKVSIPSSISEDRGSRSTAGDTLKGNDIYGHLGTFIHIGEGAADVVQNIMRGISHHKIDRAMTTSFDGDDGRTKYLEVVENTSYLGKDYALGLTISDELSMSNEDGGKAIQVFWNSSPAVEGIAILKPKNIDSRDDQDQTAIFSVEYSETGELGYDAHMIVQVAGLFMPSALEDPFAVNNIKLFVGKKGDDIDVYGNSNHPNAKFFNDEVGFNWAFSASGSESSDLAVAEVGLPSTSLASTSRIEILEDNSIKSVIENQIYALWPDIDSSEVAGYVSEMDAPGYFDETGFVSAGVKPSTDYDNALARIKLLTPFSPKAIDELTISFK